MRRVESPDREDTKWLSKNVGTFEREDSKTNMLEENEEELSPKNAESSDGEDTK